MAHYLVELYSPTPAWLALDEERRQAYFSAIGAGMLELGKAGVEAVAVGEIDDKIDHSAAQRYFAIWKLPNRDMAHHLVAAISETGWHQWFDTVNATGESVDFGAHLKQLNAAS
jgi:hypothetical protein